MTDDPSSEYDHYSYHITAENKKRKIHIKQSKVADEGTYTCKTNAEETTCELIVERMYIIYTLQIIVFKYIYHTTIIWMYLI